MNYFTKNKIFYKYYDFFTKCRVFYKIRSFLQKYSEKFKSEKD